MSLIGPEGRRQLKLAARFASAGLELVVAIVVGYFGGRLLDHWLGTDSICSYVGLILGVIAGFRNLFLLARSATPSTASPDDTNGTNDDPDHPPREP